jgi:hypothetical protein
MQEGIVSGDRSKQQLKEESSFQNSEKYDQFEYENSCFLKK